MRGRGGGGGTRQADKQRVGVVGRAQKLEDAESAVVSCAVNVICELANKNPKNYLAMAPKFFRLLTTSSNNWMLIKVGRKEPPHTTHRQTYARTGRHIERSALYVCGPALAGLR